MRVFGSLWDAPVCDGQVAEPAPIGQQCLTCGDEVVDGDQGYIMGCHRLGDDGNMFVTWEPQHRECSLLTVIGHNYGLCQCTNYEGMTMKEAGRELERRLRLQAFTGGGEG